MSIRFLCTGCQARIKVPDGTQGRKVQCPKCGSAQRVPEHSTVPAPGSPASGSTAPGTGSIPASSSGSASGLSTPAPSSTASGVLSLSPAPSAPAVVPPEPVKSPSPRPELPPELPPAPEPVSIAPIQPVVSVTTPSEHTEQAVESANQSEKSDASESKEQPDSLSQELEQPESKIELAMGPASGLISDLALSGAGDSSLNLAPSAEESPAELPLPPALPQTMERISTEPAAVKSDPLAALAKLHQAAANEGANKSGSLDKLAAALAEKLPTDESSQSASKTIPEVISQAPAVSEPAPVLVTSRPERPAPISMQSAAEADAVVKLTTGVASFASGKAVSLAKASFEETEQDEPVKVKTNSPLRADSPTKPAVAVAEKLSSDMLLVSMVWVLRTLSLVMAIAVIFAVFTLFSAWPLTQRVLVVTGGLLAGAMGVGLAEALLVLRDMVRR